MKAKLWAEKFGSADETQLADMLKAFGDETAQLIAERTKNSKAETHFPAAQGAVKEQENKFRSICSKVPSLSEGMFEKVLAVSVPEYRQWQQAAQKKASPPIEQDVADYRGRRGRHMKGSNESGKK